MQLSSSKKVKPLLFAFVAGEISGDILGATIIQKLAVCYPNAKFVGVGGPQMQAEGLELLYLMDVLFAGGFWGVIKNVCKIFRVMRMLYKEFSARKPDVFIGIDVPDFNFILEAKLKKIGIPIIHCVGPSVWAWREKRMLKMCDIVDHMLVLFPFEISIYQKYNVPVTFIGHPAAHDISEMIDHDKAKEIMHYTSKDFIVGLFPGSRMREVRCLAGVMLETTVFIKKKYPNAVFIIPCATQEIYDYVVAKAALQPACVLVQLLHGEAHKVMAAADVLLIAAGTATLEGMLHKKPMVVCYRMDWLSWQVLKWLVKIKWSALPNLLLNEPYVAECLQEDAQPEKLAQAAIEASVAYKKDSSDLRKKFQYWHLKLKQDSGAKAAQVILNVALKKI